jgi:hypothetical protein
MRRILLVLTVALLTAVMMVTGAIPALADKPPSKPPQSELQQGKYTCTREIVLNPGDPVPITETETETNIPAGQASRYPASEGWVCETQR